MFTKVKSICEINKRDVDVNIQKVDLNLEFDYNGHDLYMFTVIDDKNQRYPYINNEKVNVTKESDVKIL